MAAVESQSSNFAVISWNVLHIIHELNHVYGNSPVLARYSIQDDPSNEKKRLHDIVTTVHQLLSNYSTTECFVCLQEVPGDLLPMLRTMVESLNSSNASVHVQTYPRKPSLRQRHAGAIYTDVNESLVTIHLSGRDKADQVAWTPCPSDGGKGALTVTTTSGLQIVNIHLPYDNQAALSLLRAMYWPGTNTRFVLVGDMNRDSTSLMKTIRTVLNEKSLSTQLVPIITDKPSRVGFDRDGRRRSSSIDQYVVSPSLAPSSNSSATVFDQIGDVSDHYPILFLFQHH